MEFDIAAVPFSRYGSYMSFNVLPPRWEAEGLVLRTMHGVFASRQVFGVLLTDHGRQVDFRIAATPTLLRLEADGGWAEACFAAADLVRFRGEGVGLRLVSLNKKNFYAFKAGEGRWHVNATPSTTQYMLTPLAGSLQVDSVPPRTEAERPHLVADFTPDDSARFECAVEEFRSTPPERDLRASFDDCLREVEAEWRWWLDTTPELPERYREASKLAMYVNWTSVVRPEGNLTRPTMLMSKNWMTQCWSWDHCFNAMALSYENPSLAWDQFMTLFDHQDEYGALPDAVSAPRLTWNFCKPPVHGWALSKMMAAGAVGRPEMEQAYEHLEAWTGWWVEERDYDGDGLPEYHHGNDSGWDNATVFDAGFPATAPDLSAYLVVQMDALAGLAGRLGLAADAWEAAAAGLAERMVEDLWSGEQFVTRQAFSGEVAPDGDCLLNYLPIVAGRRLPEQIAAALAEGLQPGGRFVTEYGPATESPHSPLYEPDGYWRGPIWGPETVIVVDGLARAGFEQQAREIASRYCEMCLKSGFAENYNALTGEPLRDRAYTWGSSAFLILAHEFLLD